MTIRPAIALIFGVGSSIVAALVTFALYKLTMSPDEGAPIGAVFVYFVLLITPIVGLGVRMRRRGDSMMETYRAVGISYVAATAVIALIVLVSDPGQNGLSAIATVIVLLVLSPVVVGAIELIVALLGQDRRNWLSRLRRGGRIPR
jgi:hypothetical protein